MIYHTVYAFYNMTLNTAEYFHVYSFILLLDAVVPRWYPERSRFLDLETDHAESRGWQKSNRSSVNWMR